VTVEPYYRDESVTLWHGEALDVLRQLPDAAVDVVMTDPPYSSGGMFRADRQAEPSDKYRGWSQDSTGASIAPKAEYGTFGGDSRDQRAFAGWVGAWSFQALRATRVGGLIFCFTDWRQLPTTTDAVQFGGWIWRGVNVWDKGVGRPMRGRFRNHLEYIVWGSNGSLSDNATEGIYPSALIPVPTVSVGEREHVTQKPVELLQALLSVAGGDRLTVLDPFVGSGSTLVAARRLGHRCIGVEADERYCEMTARRLDQGVLDFGESA
jgi:site-specific DNA-methyltransferase (adenine-specific)